jgi:hypothetical protein
MTWAVAAPVESSGQRLVLIMLANHCNSHTGQCNPSHKMLAEECCMGVSTLKNHIKRLEELALLKIIHKAIDGVSLPNQYMLNLVGVGQNLADGGSEFEGRVGQNLADGGSESGRGVGQNLATNQELKPRNEPGIKPSAIANVIQRPESVSEQVWKDWLVIRKNKGAPLTETAWSLMKSQAAKAGWPIEKAIEECCLRTWASFKADWVAGKQSQSNGFAPKVYHDISGMDYTQGVTDDGRF